MSINEIVTIISFIVFRIRKDKIIFIYYQILVNSENMGGMASIRINGLIPMKERLAIFRYENTPSIKSQVKFNLLYETQGQPLRDDI